MNTAIILAAGKGTRMKAGINKQYLVLRNKSILAHSIEVFQKSNIIDEIILVINHDEEQNCKVNVIDKYGYNKVAKLVPGGETRQQSVYNGLMQINGRCSIILVHDGARPLVTPAIIERCIEGAKTFGAASAGVPIKETIKILDGNHFIRSTPRREDVWVTQTPQAFKMDVLVRAHLNAVTQGITGTDDAMLVEHMGLKVKMVEGDYENIKITTPEDLIIAEAILNYKKKFNR